jgi:uncharacterized protein YyaL (SSP411 family)
MTEYYRLPKLAKELVAADKSGLPQGTLSAVDAIKASAEWLCAAQDNSRTHDGGVARDFDLRSGWGPSYPETTGYIIPTFLRLSGFFGEQLYRERARRMVEWLMQIQQPDGGFQGGVIGSRPEVSVIFNTGQILIGLAIAAREFEDPRIFDAARRAAVFLRDSQDADGCWRSHPTPFAQAGDKSYETHVSWGLFEAERALPDEGFAEAGYRQVDWALTNQMENGWFEKNCLDNPAAPLTHTIGYVLRGVVEAYRLGGRQEYVDAAQTTADALLDCIDEQGFMAGRLASDWSEAAHWSCLTGTVQIAACWLLLNRVFERQDYQDAASRAIEYVRRTVQIHRGPGISGGVRGSFPVDGGYTRFQYPNWAAKFFIDAQLLDIASDDSKIN